MSFQKNGINLPQTPVRANKMQICSKCNKENPPQGEV